MTTNFLKYIPEDSFRREAVGGTPDAVRGLQGFFIYWSKNQI